MSATVELREKVVTGSRILARLGLSDYLGHVSTRVPDTETVLIKGRGAEVGNMLNTGPEHVVLIDLDGAPMEEGVRPPDETVLHTEIHIVPAPRLCRSYTRTRPFPPRSALRVDRYSRCRA